MMAVTDVSSVVTATRWSEEAFYLKEFIHKFKLPQIAKVVKGQYMNLGVSTLSNPSLHSTVLITSFGRRHRILAQSIKFKDNGKVVPVGPKLAIPDTYDGFFEILSEEGRAVRCIESVSELCRRFPDSVLVRDNIKAFVSKSDDIETIQDKSRLIQNGETLIIVGEVLGVKGKTQVRFLRCFDAGGENVYLPYESKGKFSAIAKEENISGVHNIRNLHKKRLPLMARLACGDPPQGLKSGQLFQSDLRLLTRLDEDCLVALPLAKDSSVVPLPLGANIKVQPATNAEYIAGMKEVARLADRANSQMEQLKDKIIVHDVNIGRDLRLAATATDKKQGPGRKTSLPHASASHGHIYGIVNQKPRSDPGSRPPDDYDEIDQIYDYVRGFAPLPKSAKGWEYISENKQENHYQKLPANGSKDTSDKKPPDPPPIETIPGRRPPHSSMDMTPPMTPPFSPPWGSPAHTYGLPVPLMAPLGPNGQMIGIVPPPHLVAERSASADCHQTPIYEKSSDSKKRQRPKTADPGKLVQENDKPVSRYIKASTHRPTNTKHKFFKSRTNQKEAPPPMVALSAQSHSNIYTPVQGSNKHHQTSPFFQLRYKSLTNLAQQEYDTLDSSNSGGKTSGDSAGSRNLPEKKSRKLYRPKSLTNLVWDLRNGSRGQQGHQQKPLERSSSKPSLMLEDRKTRLEPAGFRETHPREQSGGIHSKKLGNKRMGTLYL